MVRVVRGQMRFAARDASPDSTTAATAAQDRDQPSTAPCSAAGRHRRWPCTSLPARPARLVRDEVRPQRTDDGVRAVVDCTSRQIGGVVLESAPDGPPRDLPPAEVVHLFETDPRLLARLDRRGRRYRGRWREIGRALGDDPEADDLRSPPGRWWRRPPPGLPEQVGGERNWDYRYTWVRDASFSVYALLGLGYTEEAQASCSGWRPHRR